LTQLEQGEAYRLARDEDGVVRSNVITEPAKVAFIDMLNDAFNIDLNQIKRQRMSAQQQKQTKKRAHQD